MTTTSVIVPPKLHLFDLPPPLIASVIESLLFEESVRLVDFIMLSNTRGRDMWHAQIKRSLRCPDMDNRRYSHESLKWVLKRGIAIKNFTTRELVFGDTELHYACENDEAWIVRACIAFNDKRDMNANAPDVLGWTPLHLAITPAHMSTW